jgi:hypothetical protein
LSGGFLEWRVEGKWKLEFGDGVEDGMDVGGVMDVDGGAIVLLE